jgi:hypothetical protein
VGIGVGGWGGSFERKKKTGWAWGENKISKQKLRSKLRKIKN